MINYNQILQASKNKINDKEASKIFNKLLNKTDVKRESNKADVQHLVLAYLFVNGLLENGYILDISVDKITKDLGGISKGPVNTVLGTFGYKYERDRVTPKKDNGSQGLMDRYFKFEYVEDKTGNRVRKYSRSVFSLVVNEKLYDKLDELGVTGYKRLSSDELEELHNKVKEGSYTKKTVIEHPEDMPIVFKQTETTYNEDGADVEVQYHGLKEMVEWANGLLENDEVKEEKAPTEFTPVEEISEDSGQEGNDEGIMETSNTEDVIFEEEQVELNQEELEVMKLLDELRELQPKCKSRSLPMAIERIESMLASEYRDLDYIREETSKYINSYSQEVSTSNSNKNNTGTVRRIKTLGSMISR